MRLTSRRICFSWHFQPFCTSHSCISDLFLIKLTHQHVSKRNCFDLFPRFLRPGAVFAKGISYRNHGFSTCFSRNLLLWDTPWRWRNWKLALQRPILPCQTTTENPDAWQKGFNLRTRCLFTASALPDHTAWFLIIIGQFYFAPLGHDHSALTQGPFH